MISSNITKTAVATLLIVSLSRTEPTRGDPLKGRTDRDHTSANSSLQSYGPKLPEGEEGQDNIDAGEKLLMIYLIGGAALALIALITLLSVTDDKLDERWN